MVGLCDYNPFGLALLMTYRFATVNSAFEGVGHETPSLRWLGLRRAHVLKLKSADATTSATAMPDPCSSFLFTGPFASSSPSSVSNDNMVVESGVAPCTPSRDYEQCSYPQSTPTNEFGTLKRKHFDSGLYSQRDTSVLLIPFQTDALMQSMTMIDRRKIRAMLASDMFKTLPHEYSVELVNMQNGTFTC